MKYYRNRNSIYANYRYNNPHQANFIAPQGKVANFMFDEALEAAQQYGGHALDAAQQYGGQAAQWLGNNAHKVGQGIQDLYAQGVAKTGINVPGMVDGAGRAIQNAAVTAGRGADMAYDAAAAGAGRAGQMVGDAAQYVQGHPGQDAAVAGGAAGLAGVGAGLRRFLRGRKPPVADVAADVAQAAPGGLSGMQKAGLAGAGALGVGGAGALGYNAMNQDEAQYASYLARRQAQFRRGY